MVATAPDACLLGIGAAIGFMARFTPPVSPTRPTPDHRDDGLQARDCYITAAVHCAPPDNKPRPGEFKRCRPYLVQELKLFGDIKVVIALGKIAFDSFLTPIRNRWSDS